MGHPRIVYEQNQSFGLGPIPKPKSKNDRYFWADIVTNQNQMGDSMACFSHRKRTPETNFEPNIKYF